MKQLKTVQKDREQLVDSRQVKRGPKPKAYVEQEKNYTLQEKKI